MLLDFVLRLINFKRTIIIKITNSVFSNVVAWNFPSIYLFYLFILCLYFFYVYLENDILLETKFCYNINIQNSHSNDHLIPVQACSVEYFLLWNLGYKTKSNQNMQTNWKFLSCFLHRHSS